MTRQRVHKFARDGARVVRLPHADFLGQRVAVQPVEQPAAQSADDAQLGKMHVRIDEPGQHDAAAQVVYRDLGMVRANGRIVAGSENHAAGQKQCAIGEALQRIGFSKRTAGVCRMVARTISGPVCWLTNRWLPPPPAL